VAVRGVDLVTVLADHRGTRFPSTNVGGDGDGWALCPRSLAHRAPWSTRRSIVIGSAISGDSVTSVALIQLAWIHLGRLVICVTGLLVLFAKHLASPLSLRLLPHEEI